MQVVFPEQALPAKLTFNPEMQMSDDEYFEFCMANPDPLCHQRAENRAIEAGMLIDSWVIGPSGTAAAGHSNPAWSSFCRPEQRCRRMPPGFRIAASQCFPRSSGGNSRRYVPSSSLKSCHPAIACDPPRKRCRSGIGPASISPG
ncbi:hypothetical protein SBA4_1670003 [Candidatus Sulfopaludibacter sp. SbA4]|nr:hypothetical protein SBA4_1670003 [Candidatus Sulfopaludibacter sp. SbA4]